MPLRLPAICVVTRARGGANSPERAALLQRLGAAARAGASMVQIRERQFDDRQLIAFVGEVIDAVVPSGAAVIVNERTDLALVAGASGVHLKGDGPSVEDVRRIVPTGFIIGRSIHDAAQALQASVSGSCDYLLFGTVFRSSSKPPDHLTAGIDGLEQVCRQVHIPVLAIGGLSVERARAVAEAGAAGIAAISLFADTTDIAATVQALADALTLPSRHV